MQKPLRYSATAEDRRLARKWTCSVLAVYAAAALTAYGLVSIRNHFADGSKNPRDPSSIAVTTATAPGDRLNR
jgi:hypothetical protein